MWKPEIIYITCPRIPKDEFVAHKEDKNVTYEDVE